MAPLKGEVIASFGSTGPGQRNDGVNIAAPQGTTVKAAAAGEVAYAGSAIPGYGNLVLIKHAGGLGVTAYAHLDTIGCEDAQPRGAGRRGGHGRPVRRGGAAAAALRNPLSPRPRRQRQAG